MIENNVADKAVRWVDGMCVLSIIVLAILSLTALDHHPWLIRGAGLVGFFGCLFSVGWRLIRPTDKTAQEDEGLSRCRQALPHGALAWFDETIEPWWTRHRDEWCAAQGRRKTEAFFTVLADCLAARWLRLPHSLYQKAEDKNRDHAVVALVFAVTVLQVRHTQHNILAKGAGEDWKLAFNILNMPALLRSLSHEAYRLWDVPALLDGSGRLRMNAECEAMLWGLLVGAKPGDSTLKKENKQDDSLQTETAVARHNATRNASEKPIEPDKSVSTEVSQESASVDEASVMPVELKKFYTLLERCIERRGINQDGWILSDGCADYVWLTEKALRDIGRKINQSPADCLAFLKAHDVLHQHGKWHTEDGQACVVCSVSITQMPDASPFVALSGRIEVSDAT